MFRRAARTASIVQTSGHSEDVMSATTGGFLLAVALFLPTSACALAQSHVQRDEQALHVLSPVQLEALVGTQPRCLQGYRTNQTGMLSRLDAPPGVRAESTFTVEVLSIPSDGVLIRGWLYLPRREGRFPLIVLTNGGGDGSRAIKSLSDWIAPVLAHCGIAAFVHDKRGTGESGGNYAETTYDDYVTDAGNSAVHLSKHRAIDQRLIGVMGGSEGGRIAVLAASRFPIVRFAISLAGTVVSMEDDRIYAQLGSYRTRGIADSVIEAITPLWKRSLAAWAGNRPADHDRVNEEIREARKRFDRDLLPFTKAEMESIPDFKVVLPTWRSMPNDYLTELTHFTKPWLAMFGEVDVVVPTQASVRNIERYMALSGNREYTVAVIPRMGHAPVDVETKRLVRIDNLVLNWLHANVIRQ